MANNDYIDFDNLPEVSFYDYDSGGYNFEDNEQETKDETPEDFNENEDYPDFGEDKEESSFDEDFFEDYENEQELLPEDYHSLLDEYFESLDFETYKEAE
jgi:hypothetical protein